MAIYIEAVLRLKIQTLLTPKPQVSIAKVEKKNEMKINIIRYRYPVISSEYIGR